MAPAMDLISEQILENQSLEGLEYPAGSQYTSMALVSAVKTALQGIREVDLKFLITHLTNLFSSCILFTMITIYHAKSKVH